MRAAALAIVVALVGCNSDLDEPWQLAHDRIIAVRANPPRILPGEQSTIDLLIGYAEMPVEERGPDLAMVVSPTSLADVLAPDGGAWVVTAPDEDRLAAARAELGLEANEPVPLQVGVAVMWPYDVTAVDGRTFAATKTIYLGESAQNPEPIGMMIDGSEPASELVVPKEDKVPLFVEADDKVDIVNWLTSCGEMHDFDLHSAYLKVLPDQPQDGQLAVVLRDDRGGVTWRVWPIRAE
ncbi:MAG TPA: hypothetical protein VFS15_09960 [Kofleriaceae bacterium]|nr:hypothetical protein [Kofleriaceae bacterium]